MHLSLPPKSLSSNALRACVFHWLILRPNDLKEMKLHDWRICIQDRNKQKGIVEKAKTFNI
jgi:hypothetical protein